MRQATPARPHYATLVKPIWIESEDITFPVGTECAVVSQRDDDQVLVFLEGVDSYVQLSRHEVSFNN